MFLGNKNIISQKYNYQTHFKLPKDENAFQKWNYIVKDSNSYLDESSDFFDHFTIQLTEPDSLIILRGAMLFLCVLHW